MPIDGRAIILRFLRMSASEIGNQPARAHSARVLGDTAPHPIPPVLDLFANSLRHTLRNAPPPARLLRWAAGRTDGGASSSSWGQWTDRTYLARVRRGACDLKALGGLRLHVRSGRSRGSRTGLGLRSSSGGGLLRLELRHSRELRLRLGRRGLAHYARGGMAVVPAGWWRWSGRSRGWWREWYGRVAVSLGRCSGASTGSNCQENPMGVGDGRRLSVVRGAWRWSRAWSGV